MRSLTLALAILPIAPVARAQAETNFPDPVIQAARDQFMAGDAGPALEVLRPLAEGGAVRAQNILGTAYQYGDGVGVDAVQALRWFGMAAAQGYPTAMHNLGYLYEVGMPGQPANLALARSWYQRAAALDYGPSLGSFGGLLLVGQGGPADPDRGLAVLRRGLQLGDPGAVEWLAWAHLTATGVAEDLAEARRLYEIAALQDRPNAANEYGMLVEAGQGGPADPERAMRFYEQAVAGDITYAGINAAWMVFDFPDLFPDAVLGLAYCFWAVDHAAEPERSEYATACDEVAAAQYAPAQVQAARKQAQAL